MLGTLWLDRLEARTDVQADDAQLERRIAALERQLADLTEWVAALGDDLITRTHAEVVQ
jgi:chaperonin cofactor prefoldin